VKPVFARLVETFETDPRWLWRALAAGVFGLVVAAEAVWQSGEDVTTVEGMAMIFGFSVFSLAGGCLLAIKDIVRGRMKSRQKVGYVSQILFGLQWRSLMLWFVLLLVIGFPLAALIGNLTWK
jgi:hypothetical protein